MALYAFDGTWNDNQPDDDLDTNVRKFFEAHESESKDNFYVPGPGTRYGWLGKLLGGTFGFGGKQRVEEAYEALKKNFRGGDRTIDIVGFSRGSALALDFCNRIHDKGVGREQAPAIRFLGLWDTVASFGIPGNEVNLTYKLTVPANVKKCFHALALDERRHNFTPERLGTHVEDADKEGRVYEVWFRGVHSDVGGGNKERGLPSIALHWMLVQAQRCGVPIRETAIGEQRERMNPDAKIYKNTDPIVTGFRPVKWNDLVHFSVKPRGKIDGVEHHNPPKNCAVVGDDMKPAGKFKTR